MIFNFNIKKGVNSLKKPLSKLGNILYRYLDHRHTMAAILCTFSVLTAIWLIFYQTDMRLAATSDTTTLPSPQHNPIQTHWVTETLKHGDNLSTLFQQHGIPAKTLVELNNNTQFQKLSKRLQVEQQVHIGFSPQQQMTHLRIPIDVNKDLLAKRQQDQSFDIHIHQTKMERQYAYAKLTIEDSLHRAAQRSNLDINITQQLANIYGDRLNMKRDLRKGDQFEVLYEQYLIDGKVAKTGDIVAAKCQHKQHQIDAIRYQTDTHDPGYYDLAGHNLQKSFLRYPCQFKRISSPFSPHRLHPILRINRPHYGVDLAADHGTPVKAVADGVISSIGYQGGYGRTVKIKHGNARTTIYAHLSRYAKTLKKGTKVRKGQVIAYVGSSGYATGPHLHFEIRVNDKPINPLTASLPTAQPLSDTEMAQYLPTAKQWLNMLNQQQLSAEQHKTNHNKAQTLTQ